MEEESVFDTPSAVVVAAGGATEVEIPESLELMGSLLDTEIVHDFTSTTCWLPSASVCGVKTIVQVSVTTPSGESVEVTVCTV